MNNFISYFIEANFGLLFFAAVYWVILRRENQFSINRGFLLIGVFFSLLFPILDINFPPGTKIIPSLNLSAPTYWLQEISIGSNPSNSFNPNEAAGLWPIIGSLYWIVLSVQSILFLYQVTRVITLILTSTKYRWNSCFVTESSGSRPTFSFFNFIFIGQADQLTPEEKKEILRHELVHVRKLHSFDTILINVLAIAFWFNPILHVYRKVLMQLHEFEADALAAENQDTNQYCLLLTKVALTSGGFSVVNHFNNSLTLKRIAMLTTIKKKIQNWKAISLLASVVLCFLIVSCQDQVISDLKNVNKNSATTGFIPTEVKSRLDDLQKSNPSKEYAVIQLNEEGKQTLEKMGGAYNSVSVITTRKNSDGEGLTYVIVQKGPQITSLVNVTISQDSIYSLVEETPSFIGGFDALSSYIMREIRYPEAAKKNRIHGKVFIAFVITKEGNVVDPKVVKGVDPEIDKEALRVVSGLPKWIPGKQKGENVNVRYIMPINFEI